jgi:hypothetical protein
MDTCPPPLPRTRKPRGLKIMSGVPARMEGLADRHQGVREGCTRGGADLRTVLPPGAIHALPLSTYIIHQCCGSGMFIPDPTFFHPGSRILTFSIPDPHQRI